MKNLLFILSFAIMLTACGNSKTQKSEQSTPVANITVAQLSGEWAKSGYKNELIKNISPMKVGKMLTGNTGVCIGKAENDSAFVLILINNHEGITGNILGKKPGKAEGSFEFISDSPSDESIDIMLTETDSIKTLVLITYNKAGEKTNEDTFEYVAEPKDINDPCGLTAIDVLLNDSWSVLDIKDKEIAKIEINKFGEIKGWKDYSSISIMTDAIFGGNDEIRLSTDNSMAGLNLIADFMGDKILLYEAIESDSLPTSEKGKKVYSFIRDNIGKGK